MINKEIKYSYNDLTIVPETISDINSRSECNPFCDVLNRCLPIFTSPMSTIVNKQNVDIWKKNHIIPIFPRNIDGDKRGKDIYDSMIPYYLTNGYWVALSLSEFKSMFVDREMDLDWYHDGKKHFYVCVDLANGHMKSLYESINKAKELSREFGYGLTIMTGNIANPKTYKWICENAEVDYIRLSIGTGNNCITTTQTSVHYPIASLIDECYQIKQMVMEMDKHDGKYVKSITYERNGDRQYEYYKSCPKIVADGGIRGYADVIKALALGADYVMIGSLFTGLLESAAPLNIECYNSHYKYQFNNDEYGTVNNGIIDILGIWENTTKGLDCHWEQVKRDFIHDMKEITKESYGMSTKKAQKLINPSAPTKTSEGCTKYIKVKETVAQWTFNMIDYMKSAMSYTNKRTLDDFRGNVDLVVNSSCAILAVNK